MPKRIRLLRLSGCHQLVVWVGWSPTASLSYHRIDVSHKAYTCWRLIALRMNLQKNPPNRWFLPLAMCHDCLWWLLDGLGVNVGVGGGIKEAKGLRSPGFAPSRAFWCTKCWSM
jgi:hypothetical protein